VQRFCVLANVLPTSPFSGLASYRRFSLWAVTLRISGGWTRAADGKEYAGEACQ
jgi:uncharacterized protein YbdZ (MbtH family)